MARGGRPGKKRTKYVRDAQGQFASTPGGGASKPSPAAVRKAAKAAAMKGGSLAARTSLRKSRAKLAASPSPQQKGAVTRGNKAARAAIKTSRTTIASDKDNPRKIAAAGLLKLAKSKPKQKPVETKPATKPTAKSTAKPTTKTKTKTTANGKSTTTKKAVTSKKIKEKTKTTSKEPTTRKVNLAAERAKRMASKTGVVPGSKFESGKSVRTLSLKEMRSAVIKSVKGKGKAGMAAIANAAGTGEGIASIRTGRMPRTRSEWERAYRARIKTPMSDRGRKERPGIVNGIDIHKNFRPWAVFGLDPKTASKGDVEQAYRRTAKKVHPDAGGRQKDFERIKTMRDSIVALMNADKQMKGGSKKSTPKTSPKTKTSSKTKKKPRSSARPSILMLPPSRS